MTHYSFKKSKILVMKIFARLNEEKIPYVVLRNYESLPDSIGHDIDILVDEKAFERYLYIIHEVLFQENWIIIQKENRLGFQSNTVTSTQFEKQPEKSIRWDTLSPYTWKGITWVDTDEVMKQRIFHKNLFYVPSPGTEGSILLLKELLQQGKIRERYYSRIQSGLLKDPEGFKLTLKKFFDEEIVIFLLTNAQMENWDTINANFKSIRSNLIIKSIKSNLSSFLFNSMKFVFGHFTDYLNGRNNLFICLIGPDGSGKSTVSQGIIDATEDLFDKRLYFHGHYGIIPELKQLLPFDFGNKTERKISSVNGGKRSVKPVFIYVMMVYYALDFIIGSIKYSFRRNSSHLILFDRYFYDYCIQNPQITPDNFLFRVLSLIVPRPDLIIYLNAPAELIFDRKPELTVDEIRAQEKICREITRREPRAFLIDNTLPLDTVIDNIRTIIVKKLRSRVKK